MDVVEGDCMGDPGTVILSNKAKAKGKIKRDGVSGSPDANIRKQVPYEFIAGQSEADRKKLREHSING